MQNAAVWNRLPVKKQKGLRYPPKILLAMKLTMFFLTTALLSVSAKSTSQQITYSGKEVFLEDIFKVVKKQTGYHFFYDVADIKTARKVNVSATNLPLESFLFKIFENQPLEFEIKKKSIIISRKQLKSSETDIILNELPQKLNFDVSGIVVDSDGKPVAGVSVTVRNGVNGTTTDDNGQFVLKDVKENDELVFTSVGMNPRTIKISKKPAGLMSITLERSYAGMDELLITGYKVEKKKDLTGAVSVVSIKDVQDIPSGNVIKTLQGRIPGVSISTDGNVNSGASIRIRGIGTFGNNDPLFVIDGIPTKKGMQDINENDIESIQVLKDASSASIYGSRAANGVIIITTKRPKNGSKIEFTSTLSNESYASRPRLLNTKERGEVLWRAAINDGVTPGDQLYSFDWSEVNGKPVLNEVILPEYLDPQQTMKPANTDWFKEVTRRSLKQDYNLTISNSNNHGSTLFSLNFFDNKGIVKETGYTRYTARLNSSYSFLKGKLKVGENLLSTYSSQVLIPTNEVMWLSYIGHPAIPVHTIQGGWGGPAPGMTDRHNPVRLIEDNTQNKNRYVRIFGNVYANLELVKGLVFTSNLGIDYSNYYERRLRKSYTSGFLQDLTNQLSTGQNFNYALTWQNTLNYSRQWRRHDFSLLAGAEQIKYYETGVSASRQGYALEDLNFAYISTGTSNVQNGGGASGYALVSQFGKLNYAYDNRYLASFTIRRDGSSRFGKNNQYGIFPAFSLGWRISEENFIKETLPVISDLKFRFGWGKNGNQEIDNNAVYSLYLADYAGTSYDLGGTGTGQLPSGFTLAQRANNNLKWEATAQSNYGLDFGLWSNMLRGSVDYFVKQTTDILIRPPYLGVMGGGGSRWVNGASLENKGIELLLSYDGKIAKDVSYSVTGNFSTYRNKVVFLPNDVVNAYGGNGLDKNIIGRSIQSIFGYVANGIFRTQEEVDNHADQPGKGLGRIRFEDMNKDGVVDDKDRDWIGDGQPKFSYGLNFSLQYKKIDFNCFFQGINGNDIYNGNRAFEAFGPSLAPGVNWDKRILNAWTVDNPQSDIPALTLVDRNNEGRSSTFFLQKGSYLKLRNIQLGYTFSKSLLERVKMQQGRVYIMANNLLTFKSKSYTSEDPELPNISNPGANAYPLPRSLVVGVQIAF